MIFMCTVNICSIYVMLGYSKKVVETLGSLGCFLFMSLEQI